MISGGVGCSLGNNGIYLQIYFRTGIYDSGMQTGILPDCAEYFIVVCLQENCRVESIMEFTEKNCRKSFYRR